MPDAEFCKGTLLLSFSAYIALLYFKGASKETGFIREKEHIQMKCDTGIHQALSVLFRQTIISLLNRTLGRGAGAVTLHFYANTQEVCGNCCCKMVFKPVYLNNANQNQAIFILLLPRSIPSPLSEDLSSGKRNCAIFFSRSAPGLFWGTEVQTQSCWTLGQYITCFCVLKQLSLLKGKKSHLIITWPMGAKYSSWYNELCILIGFIIKKESSREKMCNMEAFSTVTGKGASWRMSL